MSWKCVVTQVPRDCVVMRYPVRPEPINPFLCVPAEVFRFEPDPPFLGEEAWLVLAEGYPAIIVRYPVKAVKGFAESELDAIRARCCGEQVITTESLKVRVGLSYE